MLHFNLAKKFGTEPLEVLDALKAAKMFNKVSYL